MILSPPIPSKIPPPVLPDPSCVARLYDDKSHHLTINQDFFESTAAWSSGNQRTFRFAATEGHLGSQQPKVPNPRRALDEVMLG